MQSYVMNASDLKLPEPLAKKFAGQQVTVSETKDGLVIKPVRRTYRSARGIAKGSKLTSERFAQLKAEEKSLER